MAQVLSYYAQKLLTLALLALVSRAGASPLFEDDSVLAINLTGPFSTLIEEKQNSVELPFVLRANDLEHLIKVRVRGKSRKRVCDFPPLRLNFAEEKTGQTVFAAQDKLKLVTHCRNSASAQANLLEEYAAYKIFNLISDVGYKVRLVQITYSDVDERAKAETFVRYGFIIESTFELADRVGGEPVHLPGVSLGSLDTQQAATVFVFQYLIGNTDWSLVTADEDDTCCHNGDLFKVGSHRFYVPYDFDLSGLVNARYARPDPSLRISIVTQRRYRGYCISSEALEAAIRAIARQKNSIQGVVRQVPGLAEKNIETAVTYLDKFFVQANDVDRLARSFERRCL